MKTLVLVLMFLMAVPASANVIIFPTEDTYTDSSNPTVNYGTSGSLWLEKTESVEKSAYLKFDLSSYAAEIASNKIVEINLKFMPYRVNHAGSIDIYLLKDDFYEDQVTYSNRPTSDTQIYTESIPITASNNLKHISIDVTGLLTRPLYGNPNKYAILLKPSDGLNLLVYSRQERDRGRVPFLEIKTLGESSDIISPKITAMDVKNTQQDTTLEALAVNNVKRVIEITANATKNDAQDILLNSLDDIDPVTITSVTKIDDYLYYNSRYPSELPVRTSVLDIRGSHHLFIVALNTEHVGVDALRDTIMIHLGDHRLTKFICLTARVGLQIVAVLPPNITPGTHVLRVSHRSGKAKYPITIGGVGATGSKGDKGDTGLAGADGTDGTDGSQGDKGDTGLTGNAGADGTDGADGSNGADGAQGIKGDKGDTGIAGSNGADGTDGIAGADGTEGARGLQGLTGNDGSDGATGARGLTGSQGVAGASGATGAQGARGPSGAKGATGAIGPAGMAGGCYFAGQKYSVDACRYTGRYCNSSGSRKETQRCRNTFRWQTACGTGC